MPISRRELIKRLQQLGFSEPKPGGKHAVMTRGRMRIAVPNPHGGKDIDDALLRRILRQAEVTLEEFNKTKE